MQRYLLIVLGLIILVACEKKQPPPSITEKPLYQMVSRDITRLLKLESEMTVKERILYNSKLGLNTPYLIYGLGEGITGKYDPDPLYDLARVDCMTFCEQILALSIASDFRSFFWVLQKIRYRDGKISYVNRNHYTIIDWLPANSWLLYDATEEIGGEFCQEISKEINKARFFRTAGVPEEEIPADSIVSLTIKYIPKDKLMKIRKKLQGGEIVSQITQNPAVFSSHMGLIAFDEKGKLVFRNASSRKQYRRVVDIPFEDFVQYLIRKTSNLGLVLMRVNFADQTSPFRENSFLEIEKLNLCKIPHSGNDNNR